MSELYTWLLRPDDLVPGAVLALATSAGVLGAWLARAEARAPRVPPEAGGRA